MVGFVRAAVQQIFAFQVQGSAGPFGQVPAFGQGRRTTGVVFQQVGEFRLKGRVLLRADKGLFQLAQGGHQDLRHIHAAEFAEVGVQ